MNIKTKIDIHQEAFFISDNKVVSAKVTDIEIRVSTTVGPEPEMKVGSKVVVIYGLGAGRSRSEEDVFESKEELTASL